MSLITVKVEGVRRNFTATSVFLYSVSLIDETERRYLIFGVERHEALPIVAALHHLPLPRQETINFMADTLTWLDYRLEEVHIKSHSLIPPRYNLSECMLRFRSGETIHEQTRHMRPDDAIGLALLMQAPITIADDVFKQMGGTLAEGQTLELIFATYLLRQAGISLSEDKKLRLGYSKTPLRDGLVKEFRTSLQGKAPIFPEEDMEQKKKEYLHFLLRDAEA